MSRVLQCQAGSRNTDITPKIAVRTLGIERLAPKWPQKSPDGKPEPRSLLTRCADLPGRRPHPSRKQNGYSAFPPRCSGRRKWGSSPPFRLTARAATRPIGWRMPESRVSPTNATLNASFAAVRFRNGKDIPSLSISRLSNPASVAARAFKAR